MSQDAPWHARPVFISSTFNDMHAERDHLQQYVFPELGERLRAHRHHLEVVDLRWGVETASLAEQHAKELLVLKVCFAEIDRSSPFMIALLGDRYGWTPPPERVAAAAGEAALGLGSGPHSITALELEYGALREPSRARRSFFYFRESLPYRDMPAEVAASYTDEHARPEDFSRLRRLKERLEREFPDRVRRYCPGWDSSRYHVVGLDEFGKAVLDDLWGALSEELGLSGGVPATWQAEEQLLIDTFIEENCRSFSGRDEFLARTVDEIARPKPAGTLPATVLTGKSGSGKSALFAAAARRLLAHDDLLLLTHSAGVSPRSIQVELMLRRWCSLLSDFLGVADESHQVAKLDELRRHFVGLLGRAADIRRVVMMVDALDQFERTPAAKYLTWLPAAGEWPAGVSLFATATQGTELGVLETLGAGVEELPPLTPEEAIEISERLCSHYHKTLPPAVKAALLDRRLPDGSAAAGNPLWLTLVVNELLVLDADDFARLPDISGSAEEKLLKLLTLTVETIPPDVAGTYDYVFTRVESTYGQARVGAVLSALAASRYGLRESDLRALLPRLAPLSWDAALFAAIRRAMRAQLHQYGEAGKWAYTHARVREAAAGRYLADAARRRDSHARIAEHLGELPEGDVMRHERMHHLIHADDPEAAGLQLISPGEEPEKNAMFSIMRQFFYEEAEGGRAAAWLSSMLEAPLLKEKIEADIANGIHFFAIGERLLEFTEVSGLAQSSPELIRELLRRTCAVAENRLREEPGDVMAQQVLYRHLQNLAQAQADLGEKDAALEALTRAGEIGDRHARGRRTVLEQNASMSERDREVSKILFMQNERDRMLNFWRVGDLYLERGEPEEAQAKYERAMEIGRWFLNEYPDSPLARSDMAFNHYLLGSVGLDRRDFNGARAHYEAALEFSIWLTERDPANHQYGALLVQEYVGLGRTLTLLGEPEVSRRHYARALEVCSRMVQDDPGDLPQQWALLSLYDELAGFFALLQDIDSAFEFVALGVQNCMMLINTAGHSPNLARYLQKSYERASLFMAMKGDAEQEAKYALYAAEIAKRLEAEE
jgi:tetratricopeptide (TPR) repeat protein